MPHTFQKLSYGKHTSQTRKAVWKDTHDGPNYIIFTSKLNCKEGYQKTNNITLPFGLLLEWISLPSTFWMNEHVK